MTKTQKAQTKQEFDYFPTFAKKVNERWNEMSKGELYVTNIEDLFERYLKAWPLEFNPIVKTRTLHDCNTCKSFIRRLGGVVSIIDNEVQTVWQDLDLPEPYKTVADYLDDLVSSRGIVSVFRTKERQYGTEYNYANSDNQRHDHFWGRVADRHYSKDKADTKRGEVDSIVQVFNRGLEELRTSDLEDVLDLIKNNGIYRGEEHREAVAGFLELARQYRSCDHKRLFAWEHYENRFSRFRNTAIGTLLVDLSEGKDLEQAVKAFEVKVAPANYKRPTAIITQKMVEDATQKITDLGLHGAIARRHARLSDISVADVLFVNQESRKKMKSGIESLLEGSVKQPVPRIPNGTVEVTADDFVTKILPGTKELSLVLENRHLGNFVSITGADGPERLFKWDNNFAWSYDGNVTDSVKQKVKAAGGKVDCKLRVSLSWFNFDDLDLHARTPRGEHIFFGDKQGILDVDMNAGGGTTRTPVENLAFDRLQDGVYKVYVNQYSRRETQDVGFEIEVEHDGVLMQYQYDKGVVGDIPCFQIKVKNGEVENIVVDKALVGNKASKEKWGVKTNTQVPVNLVCYSPNHWGQNKSGAKHLIFALHGCKNPEPTRGIYNEFLRPELEAHRKVFEALGNKTKVSYQEEQVSGVGFTAARGDSVNVIVDGCRSYLVKF